MNDEFDFNIDIDIEEEFFDVDLSIEDDLIENRYIKPKLYKKPESVKYYNAVKFVDEMKDKIRNGDRLFCLAAGGFIFGDLIEALAVQANMLIEEMTISTLSLSKNNVDSLENLIVGDYLRKLNLIISDYFFSHNRQNIQYVYDKLDINNSFQLAVASVHTKIILIKTKNKKIVISGSANLRSSDSIECFEIETNEELYDFHYDWHKKIIDTYKTINKSIRGKKLWQVVAD